MPSNSTNFHQSDKEQLLLLALFFLKLLVVFLLVKLIDSKNKFHDLLVRVVRYLEEEENTSSLF